MIRRTKTVLSLRLSALLVVTAVVGLNGVGKVNDSADQLSSRDVRGSRTS